MKFAVVELNENGNLIHITFTNLQQQALNVATNLYLQQNHKSHKNDTKNFIRKFNVISYNQSTIAILNNQDPRFYKLFQNHNNPKFFSKYFGNTSISILA